MKNFFDISNMQQGVRWGWADKPAIDLSYTEELELMKSLVDKTNPSHAEILSMILDLENSPGAHNTLHRDLFATPIYLAFIHAPTEQKNDFGVLIWFREIYGEKFDEQIAALCKIETSELNTLIGQHSFDDELPFDMDIIAQHTFN